MNNTISKIFFILLLLALNNSSHGIPNGITQFAAKAVLGASLAGQAGVFIHDYRKQPSRIQAATGATLFVSQGALITAIARRTSPVTCLALSAGLIPSTLFIQSAQERAKALCANWPAYRENRMTLAEAINKLPKNRNASA